MISSKILYNSFIVGTNPYLIKKSNLNQVDIDVSYYPVSKKVNYALNDGKELIDKAL